MDQNMHQEIEQRLAELPEDVQAAIASSDFDEKIRLIGQAQGLHIDQMEVLSDEVMLTMLGFAPLEELAHGIEQQVRVDSTKAQAMADAVHKEILLPIRESMKAWAAGRRGETSAAPAAPAPTVASTTPSVVMPSSYKPVAPSTPAPATPPVATVPPSAPAPAPAPVVAPSLGAADAILSEKKVTPPVPAAPMTPAASPAPKTDPAQPQNYKADPYREPVE